MQGQSIKKMFGRYLEISDDPLSQAQGCKGRNPLKRVHSERVHIW